jgi:hypothetical protein
MRKILAIELNNDFTINALFDDNLTKVFDFKNYLNLPVFEPLKNLVYFKEAKNKKYFIEWEKFELDLSADTIWHEGKLT